MFFQSIGHSMQENIGNAEIQNLSNLLNEAQDLLKQYESMHEQIMQQVDQQKESIALHEQNISQSRASFEQDEQFNEQQISSALQQINQLLREPDVSPMRQVSSQINHNASNASIQSNIPVKESKVVSFSFTDNQNAARPENLLTSAPGGVEDVDQELDDDVLIEEEVEEPQEKPLMTQLNPNQLPPVAPRKVLGDLTEAQENIINVVLAADYFKQVSGAYQLAELQDADNSLTERLSQFGDERMSELQSIVSSKTVSLQRPKLSENVGHLFDSLYKGNPEILELEIPQIKNQPDFLRESIQENKLQKYMAAVDSCLKLVNNQLNVPNRDELENLLIQAELHTVGEELLNDDQIEVLCANVEAEQAGNTSKEEGDNQVQNNKNQQKDQSMASVLDSFLAAETRQSEAIEQDLKRYAAQQEEEEQLRREATATAELSKVLEAAHELLGEQPPQRRTGSAKAILDKSQTRFQPNTSRPGGQANKQRIRTPKLLDGIKK